MMGHKDWVVPACGLQGRGKKQLLASSVHYQQLPDDPLVTSADPVTSSDNQAA